ncbi:hypothetical protein VSU19_13745, partial [Verrucomicrobiales bacterium BCK34]|nr:hypothetical protein [Verrucomicrobiales bacterium BCK34]
GDRFEGVMVFSFWSPKGDSARGMEGFLEARDAAERTHTIEFRVLRSSKEEVYRIEASKYPDLW